MMDNIASIQIKIMTDIRVVSENQIRSKFTDLIQALWAINLFSDLYTLGCVVHTMQYVHHSFHLKLLLSCNKVVALLLQPCYSLVFCDIHVHKTIYNITTEFQEIHHLKYTYLELTLPISVVFR